MKELMRHRLALCLAVGALVAVAGCGAEDDTPASTPPAQSVESTSTSKEPSGSDEGQPSTTEPVPETTEPTGSADDPPTTTEPAPETTEATPETTEPTGEPPSTSAPTTQVAAPEGPEELRERVLGLRDRFRADHQDEVAPETDGPGNCTDMATEPIGEGTRTSLCVLADQSVVWFVATAPEIDPGTVDLALLGESVESHVCLGDDFLILAPHEAAAALVSESGFDCSFDEGPAQT